MSFFSLGRAEDKSKGKKGKRGEKERKGEATTKSEKDSKVSEALTTRQGPLNKSASKAIAVHTAKLMIDGGGLGPLINWDIASYLCNCQELTYLEGSVARGIRGAGDLKESGMDHPIQTQLPRGIGMEGMATKLVWGNAPFF